MPLSSWEKSVWEPGTGYPSTCSLGGTVGDFQLLNVNLTLEKVVAAGMKGKVRICWRGRRKSGHKPCRKKKDGRHAGGEWGGLS